MFLDDSFHAAVDGRQPPGWERPCTNTVVLCAYAGVDVRVVIFGFEKNPRYLDAEPVPPTVLINPQLTPLDSAQEEGWEGCLSVPGLRGVVPRYAKLRYTGFDQFGAPIDRSAEGFHARVVQHECDHLDGKLYPMRVKDFARFGFTEVLFPGGTVAED